MKTYYGNYLGMVIDNNDPEFRGRVQVFVPHIMPTLYEGWNKEGKNITINCVGDNMPQGLTSDIIERLKKILPWAEAASPIVGQSAPGGVMAAMANNAAGGDTAGGTGGNAAAGGGTGGGAGSPLAGNDGQPLVDSAGNQVLVDKNAMDSLAKTAEGYTTNTSSTGFCYRGTKTMLLKSGTVGSYLPSTNAYQAGGDLLAQNNNPNAPNNWAKLGITNANQAPPGSVIVYENPGAPGHIEVRSSSGQYVSDFTKSRPSGYKVTGIYVPTPKSGSGGTPVTAAGGSAIGGISSGQSTITSGPASGSTQNLNLSPTAIPAGTLPPGDQCVIPQEPQVEKRGLTTPFVQRLNGFYKEAVTLGYTITLCSAYRSHQKQQDLWNKDLAKNNGRPTGGVAHPYNSAHEYGIAVDMKVSGNGVSIQHINSKVDRTSNKDTPAFRALLAKYGLHQPLHPDNGGETAEKWHVEPTETKNVTRGQQGFQALENRFRQQAPKTPETVSSSQFPPAPSPLTIKNPSGTDMGQGTSPKTNLVPAAPASSITSTTPTMAGSSLGASTGTTVTTGPTTGATATTTASTGQSQLAKDRTARFQSELSNPQLLNRIEYLFFHQESTTLNPDCGSIIFETAVNRAMFLNNTLYKTLNSTYFGKKNLGKTVPATKLTQEIINRVIYQGQNHTNLAADNASNSNDDPLAMRRIKSGCTGSWFNLNTGKMLTDPAKIKAFAEGAPSVNHEFLYRPDGHQPHRTDAGPAAVKYAAKYGITPTTPSTFNSGAPLPPELAGARNSTLTNNEVGATEGPATVANTDPHGPTVIKNTNDSPKGMFTFPGLGAMVWIFFREGNPQFPVYFAASYSSEEWKAAYHGASLNPEGTNNGSAGTQMSNSMKLNPNAGGGLEFTHIKDASDPSGASDKAVAMMYGDDGSNMLFSKGYHQLYTRHDRRDQIDGHAYNIIGGAEEKWVEDDSSVNIRGNVTIKIGKIDAESMDAMKELSDFSNQLNETLMSNTATQ